MADLVLGKVSLNHKKRFHFGRRPDHPGREGTIPNFKRGLGQTSGILVEIPLVIPFLPIRSGFRKRFGEGPVLHPFSTTGWRLRHCREHDERPVFHGSDGPEGGSPDHNGFRRSPVVVRA
jgi:hypothetical protein